MVFFGQPNNTNGKTTLRNWPCNYQTHFFMFRIKLVDKDWFIHNNSLYFNIIIIITIYELKIFFFSLFKWN